MRKRLPLIILLAIVVVIGIFIFLTNEMRKTKSDFPIINNEYLYDSLDNEYTDIFVSSMISRFGNFRTFGSKKTNPISTFTFDNQFDIFIYKLNITTANPAFLRNIIEEKASIGPSNGVWYRGCGVSYFEIQYREIFSKNLQEIIVSFEKDAEVKYFRKTDSLVYYHIPDGKFSLRFGRDSTINLFGKFDKTPLFTTTPPIHLLLFKKNEYYYLLLATSKKESDLPKDFLTKRLIK
jgi:hypothetical protein